MSHEEADSCRAEQALTSEELKWNSTPVGAEVGTRLMTVIIVLLALITIPIFHRSDKVVPPIVTGRLEPPRPKRSDKECRKSTCNNHDTRNERRAVESCRTRSLKQSHAAFSRQPRHQELASPISNPQPPLERVLPMRCVQAGKSIVAQ
jgi:hypothetical protein